MPVGPPSPPYDPTRDAEKYIRLVWWHINARLQKVMGNHHAQHEPGGRDLVKLPLGALRNVSLGTVAAGDLLVYTGTARTNGQGTITVAGTASAHGAYFCVPLAGGTIPTIPPGPKNLSGTARVITAVETATDGTVSASVTGVGTWGAGTRLSVNVTSASVDATYFVVDWSIR